MPGGCRGFQAGAAVMGDRANVYIRQSDTTGIGLYSSWAGISLHEAALVARDDPRAATNIRDVSYYATVVIRLIFDQLAGGEIGETGFGLWTREDGPTANDDHPIMVLDARDGKVSWLRTWSRRGLNGPQ